MSFEYKNELGHTHISFDVIADLVGMSMGNIEGIVGMTSQNRLKDGVYELLKRENYKKGITVTEDNGEIDIDVSIITLKKCSIPKAAWELQKTIKESLEAMVDLRVRSVNIKVESVK
ncbi:Asp23/Gls24 family envelope stress response protein (plasmid) [Pontibacillus sp. ALD_SL1]|uniref:Asp23/Gls24 family envelope stress response protein n=1 Tax=Pontibacillus sp. ALD_SL1 TaxID=2777185 RepID=UPI001A961976|nr:Asp23/Gls24 family envelope stress response protein [Pontibacillus sp. ALD_SL1]QST02052.1 Asp23/Gls24 family envelope stress response protein [Pontibacillus sp. ALD_SL1]